MRSARISQMSRMGGQDKSVGLATVECVAERWYLDLCACILCYPNWVGLAFPVVHC